MTTVTMLNRWQAFVWLWRNDPEAKWYWFRAFITGHHCREDVIINYRDYGRLKP